MITFKVKSGQYYEDIKSSEPVPILEEVFEIITNGTCVFLGAGISKLAEYPLWKELADKLVCDFANKNLLASYSEKKVLLAENNCIDVMDFLRDRDDKFFDDLVRKYLGAHEITPILSKQNRMYPKEIFRRLEFLRTHNNFFITPNIDVDFQEHFQFKSNVCINPNFGQPALKSLYYIHGRVDDVDSWVFTRKDYAEKYLAEKSSLMEFLVKVFSAYQVIFFGYSLRDFEVLQAISKARMNGNPKKHFLIEGFSDYDAYLWKTRSQIIESNYGIERIGYSIDDKGFEAIYEVLEIIESGIAKRQLTQRNIGAGNAHPA